jgi:hypothetical protein
MDRRRGQREGSRRGMGGDVKEEEHEWGFFGSLGRLYSGSCFAVTVCPLPLQNSWIRPCLHQSVFIDVGDSGAVFPTLRSLSDRVINRG